MADIYLYEHDKTLPPEEWSRPGKPEWQSFLTITVKDRYRAWDLVNSLIHQLQRDETSDPAADSQPFRLALCGELHRIEKE